MSDLKPSVNGMTIKQDTIDDLFLSSPGEDLVPKTLLQLSSVPQMVKLFGPYKVTAEGAKATDQMRWADYQRMDWSVRQLPAINVFEAATENKDSDNAFLRGTVQLQVFWAPNMRRSDLSRVPAAFKGVIQNFFNSRYVWLMLDEIYFHIRPMKVAGLNEYGKTMTWSPNVEGFVGDELVPMTVVDIQYRIDLRSWNRTMQFETRTVANPFVAGQTGPLTEIDISYEGEDPNAETNPQIVVEDEITLNGGS